MLLDVRVEWGVTVLVKHIQHLFLSQDFLLLVEDIEVVLLKLLVHLLHLERLDKNDWNNLRGHLEEPNEASQYR